MKRVLFFAPAAMLAAWTAVPQAQGGGQPPAPATVAVGLQRAYAGIKTNLTDAAEKTSEADFSFKAAPDIRTFAGQFAHVAQFHYLFCSAAKGVANPIQGQNLEDTKTTKTDASKALADSFAFCDDAFSSLTDQSAQELVTQGRGQAARGAILSNLIAHDNEEYGIITVYMRLKNQVPPSTANRPQRGGGAGRGAPGGPGPGRN
jgi:uncharacterized damage-inducible protein DinB